MCVRWLDAPDLEDPGPAFWPARSEVAWDPLANDATNRHFIVEGRANREVGETPPAVIDHRGGKSRY
jgi:hypothetical protein